MCHDVNYKDQNHGGNGIPCVTLTLKVEFITQLNFTTIFGLVIHAGSYLWHFICIAFSYILLFVKLIIYGHCCKVLLIKISSANYR